MKFNQLILDFDGVFTDGCFYYSSSGKYLKKFGPDDSDAIKYVKNYIDISIVTADKNGFKISSKRLNDLSLKLELVKSNRLNWIKEKFNLNQCIYIADSFTDYYIFKEVGYCICFNNSDEELKKLADYVTKKNSGQRGLSEAIDHILKKFFNDTIYNFIK